MSSRRRPFLSRPDSAWRDAAEVANLWEGAGRTDPGLLRHAAIGAWWEVLAEENVVLFVTREYEHLVMAIGTGRSGPTVSYWPLPHPSGLALDPTRGTLHVASTRNPNQVFDFEPAVGTLRRGDIASAELEGKPLFPLRSRFYPGCLYLHDLGLLGGVLHGAASGQNAVVRLDPSGTWKRVWWPRCIETRAGPVFEQNHIQLNAIAAGKTLARSYFCASADTLTHRRPGHRNFPVDGRGVIFSGRTHEPVLRGLTRPHSVRLHQGRLWVNNSGYGELNLADRGRRATVARLPGWTRGLAFGRRTAFVGTSRVLPRFRAYAPGLDPQKSLCGVHAVDARSGDVLGSLMWPSGDQIFAIEAAPPGFASGFPFPVGKRRGSRRIRDLFYTFTTEDVA